MYVLDLLFNIVFFVSYIITDQDIWFDAEIYIQFSVRRFCITWYIKAIQIVIDLLKKIVKV